MGRNNRRKRPQDMTTEELMEFDRQEAREQQEREEERLAERDVTRGEYEELEQRLLALEARLNEA